jgi:nucleoside-diphosphate-sugar epimerase
MTANKCIITGVAGFIGSHLAERLLFDGYEVVGIDSFSDYYPRPLKERNLSQLVSVSGFSFIEADLCSVNISSLISGAAYIFHLAAQPGVRKSWGVGFGEYVDTNVTATQRLLEAAHQVAGLKKLVYASSSSVYGDCPDLPLREESTPKPISPYGVTKLAGEHLVRLYHVAYGLPTVSLRYFTVYGPRQRPDMAFYRFLRAIYGAQEIEVYGNGEQTRDFTYVCDIVNANTLAMSCSHNGGTFNIGGGSRVTINHCIELLSKITQIEPKVCYLPAQPGDARDTWADITAARLSLGYEPTVGLTEGLTAERAWYCTQALADGGLQP